MYIVWFVAGIVLVIVELMTGTLYLLVLGIAAVLAALAAYLGVNFAMQVGVFAVASVAALALVRWRRPKGGEPQSPPLELGQSVVFENWLDPAQRTARVRYRGTLWDARVVGGAAGAAGEVLYITAIDGATLTISKQA
jgi:membrane protein implicated in regulation of membrane protease activity